MLRSIRPLLVATLAMSALALAGCAGSSDDAVGEPQILRGDWVLVQASDTTGNIELGDAKVTLGFHETTGGVAACNNYSATVEGGPGKISVTDVVQTKMACVPAEKMLVESRYLSALARSHSAEYVGSGLVLTGKSIELKFEPDEGAGVQPSMVPTDPDKPVTGCGGDADTVDPDYVCPQ